MEPKELEKYSSAVSLSDMEIFVFPELMYSLVLANIMSPALWKWRENETFKKLEGKSPYRKLMRMRQFIMDEYEFNLDLNTWGLTNKDVELERFSPFISPDKIAESNALFGYHGDEYYFDLDIRRHFGLDQYEGDIIPYWKTETIEAMDAFRYKQSYTTGAGECVSLAALYIAAGFVVCGIPLEEMYMILTPLHSQNYIDVNEGVITNNRRILTKSMWFNGTEITNKAQRALRNEQVTIVSHSSGYVHFMYEDASISPESYAEFVSKLKSFLKSGLDLTIFANFLRSKHEYMKYFAFCRHHHGKHKYIDARTFFRYEHGSKFKIAADTIDKLFDEVADDDFSCCKGGKEIICVNDFIKLVRKLDIDFSSFEDVSRLSEYLEDYLDSPNDFIEDLWNFLNVVPALPTEEKNFQPEPEINLKTDMAREEVIEHLEGLREANKTVDLAFYAYRDMKKCTWEPFLKASLERCPVCLEKAADLSSPSAVYSWLKNMDDGSIYDSSRLAHPDEVANYMRGDGIEKAVTMACILNSRGLEEQIEINIQSCCLTLSYMGEIYEFESSKEISKKISIEPDAYSKPLSPQAAAAN
ncbi:hypothetical protein [Sedimentisphaera salicampi]|uniref:Uncharacterized protein n=1 Tax=Sedimentisphaera salicampi TaxID=1941349 RepID=A0A1W6LMS6_9BACT|nr:hypothetical protein [Sedimentisphaera salicampi]ARN57043.1 hypothetical protein STSP1_01438 [Sedimentisphaera salicampi]